MVRNARFSWDDTDDFSLPDPGVRISDLDDPATVPLCRDDDEAELSRRRSQSKREPGSRHCPPTRPRKKLESRCHLAGADWLHDTGLIGNQNAD